MRVAYNDEDDRPRLRDYVQFNKNKNTRAHTHTYTHAHTRMHALTHKRMTQWPRDSRVE